MQINFFPIQIPFDQFHINTEPFSKERLDELRDKFNSTHSFFRNGDNIYISNKEGEDGIEIGSPVTRDVFGDEKITSALIKHIFFRTFKDRFPGYIPVDFYPFRFFSRKDKDDVIYSLLPDYLKNKVAYKKLIEVQLRKCVLGNQVRFGFTINIKRNWIFNKTCKELASEGFDITGLEVLRSDYLPGLKGVLAPDEELIGTVKKVEGEHALVDTNEGEQLHDLSHLSIRKTKYNIGAYLSYTLSEQKSNQILAFIESKRHELYNAEHLRNEILSIAGVLFTDKNSDGETVPLLFKNKDGFCFTVDNRMYSASNSIELKTPAFIFDYAATKTDSRSADSGLTNFGPYDSITFEPKTPLVLCIGRKENRGKFTSFLANLIDGLPNSKYFKKGLHKKYEFQHINKIIEDINSDDVDEYLRVIKDIDKKPDLAIIEIPSKFKRYPDSTNPYYRIKAKLLLLEVPAQFVTSEVIANHNEYILNSIALQIYAKLGGTPWVLPSSRSVDREIIVGVGHSWVRENAFKGAAQDRIVGITTFMSSDGQYLLSDKAKEVQYADYFKELLRSLKNSFERLEKEFGWTEGDTIRLIFHIFKPIKNVEYEVVSELIRQFSQYKIQFAFVTIGKTHPFKIFDINQRGVPKYYGSTELKGHLIPERGTNIFLDSTTALVQMLGAHELKTDKHGISSPIQIRIRTPEGNFNTDIEQFLFTDLGYVVQQLFSFTYISWRSFLPGEHPATMLYSTLIAKLLSKMRNVQGWDADSLNFKLKRKKWFL
ncbi:argonaute-like protein [Pontibacter ummariensis]|uniref:Protein argonaute n=1 Tax=Pontibacter ummariensis TaxID=1610492 RepID=A0A239JE83_9BACT|nr:Piwi domain-containing protein [Pontibacter ummariensis]PRY08384.1 argonaute-like protein [Pontibacter ummariensis]SNT04130.1 Piwi domain-containing protein [Pontibacter ummariensis]